MVPAPHRGRRRHACRNLARLSRFARLHPSIGGWRKITLRLREGRHACGCRRLLNSKFQFPSSRETPRIKLQGTSFLCYWGFDSEVSLDVGAWDLDRLSSARRSISNAACAVSCLNVSRSVGKKNFLVTVSDSAKANAT